MDSIHKRLNSTETPSTSKKPRLPSEDKCAFCGYTENETEDEGELHPFSVPDKNGDTVVKVHSACLVFSSRMDNETFEEIVARVTSGKKGYYKCKKKDCMKQFGATIGCAIKRCPKVYHYRCSLLHGMLLSTGLFYCTARHNEAISSLKKFKKEIGWPAGVEYINQNDWSGIRKGDQDLIYCSVKEWNPFSDIISSYVKIVKVQEGHWAWSAKMPYDLQAKIDIPQGEAICEIVGRVVKVDKYTVHSEQCTDFYFPSKDFVRELSENGTKRLAIDSSKAGNEGRFINFLSEEEKAKPDGPKPNAELNTVWSMRKLRILVMATAFIKAGSSIILGDAADVRIDDESIKLSQHSNNNTSTSTSQANERNNANSGTITPSDIRPSDASPTLNASIKEEIIQESLPTQTRKPLPSLSINLKKSATPHHPVPSASTPTASTTTSSAVPLPNIPSSATTTTQSDSDEFPVPDASISSQSTPPSQPSLPSLVGLIDTRMQAISARYNIDFKSENIDFQQFPLRFFHELHELQSYCCKLLQEEQLKNPALFEPETSRQFKDNLFEYIGRITTPALKHSYKAFEDQLTQLEQAAASLKDRCSTVEIIFKRAKAASDELHVVLNPPPNTTNNNDTQKR